MKIFISCDIEGTCGIAHWDETEPGKNQSGYDHFRAQMTREVRAACQGVLEAGADSILVRDAHDTARNLDPSQLPREACILRGWGNDLYSMMSGLDASFDAALMTGYHSWAGGDGNPLSHTMNLGIFQVTMNGAPMSEFTLNALMAGSLGIPVPFLSGDEALCKMARRWIPGITTVAVNRGSGGAAFSIHPDVAVDRIAQGTAQALKGDWRACRVPMPEHYDLAVTFREHKTAFSRSFYPGARLADPRTVAFSSEDFTEVLRFCHFVL